MGLILGILREIDKDWDRIFSIGEISWVPRQKVGFYDWKRQYIKGDV